MKIKVKKQKLWLGLLVALIICSAVLTAVFYLHDKDNNTNEAIITKNNDYLIEDISLEVKKVQDVQYQILNIDYYDDDIIVNKQILVDLENQTCLWDSRGEIVAINMNENCYTVYENEIIIEEGNENKMSITKNFYSADMELNFLSVQITLTKENYERIFP